MKVKQNDLQKFFLHPEDLQRTMDAVFENEYFDTTDLIYRAYLWMLFAGIPKDETILITKSEVDIVKMQIVHDDHVYNMFQQAYTSMEKLCRLTSFEVMNMYHSRQHPTNKQRVDNDLLLAGISDHISTETLKSMISRKSSHVNVQLSPKAAEISGAFYRFASLPDSMSVRKRMSMLSEKDRTIMHRHRAEFLKLNERT